MKKAVVAIGLLFLCAQSAYADVDRLTIRYGGGCVSTSLRGSCTIRVTAQGTDLDTEGVWIYTGANRNTLLRLSPRARPLSAEGYATFRVKNVAGGCYRVRTSPNGNLKPDRYSNILCEK
jgi:hypothetical protein